MTDKKHCATCGYFANEDAAGMGWCNLYDFDTLCGSYCKEHEVFSKCETCLWYEKFEGVCVNSSSRYCADFPPYLIECEWFELFNNKNS